MTTAWPLTPPMWPTTPPAGRATGAEARCTVRTQRSRLQRQGSAHRCCALRDGAIGLPAGRDVRALIVVGQRARVGRRDRAVVGVVGIDFVALAIAAFV